MYKYYEFNHHGTSVSLFHFVRAINYREDSIPTEHYSEE